MNQTKMTESAGAGTSKAYDGTTRQKQVVVVGGGWAGFGAASHLAAAGVNVTLLEAQPSAGGLAAGWKTDKGNKVEVGIHGFWRSYRNIFRLITDELKLDARRVFTPYVRSALHTKEGVSVVAPILGDLPRLPAPLGPALYPQFRLSALGLTKAFLDFDGSDVAWRRYDKITARELFRSAGVSQRLYDEFLEPMLLVLPMCPGEDCSAAAALSCFQYFALEHQGDFDVRWLRGSASDLIFAPWLRAIEEDGGQVLGGKRVSTIRFKDTTAAASTDSEDTKSSSGVVGGAKGGGEGDAGGEETKASTSSGVVGGTKDAFLGGEGGADGGCGSGGILAVETTDGQVFEADAVVLAVGITAAKGLVRSSPRLAAQPEFQALSNLRGVDVVAVRLFFKERINLPRAASVAGGGMAPGLEQAGLTFYHLNDLQDAYRSQEASVVEVDMYHASSLLPLKDEGVMETALKALNTALPELGVSADMLEDFAVVRAVQAVSHFFPGAFQHMPTIQPCAAIPGVLMCGDWVDRGGHRSWSQEKALVEGRRAAAAACKHLKVREGYYPSILPVEEDEPHLALGREAFKGLRSAVPIRASMEIFLP
eukprot:jgi/Undpi1/3050/HiC_scaffold_15.g06426.m1